MKSARDRKYHTEARKDSRCEALEKNKRCLFLDADIKRATSSHSSPSDRQSEARRGKNFRGGSSL